MIAVVISLFLIGLFLSAFFSGSETGFYRVARPRLLLDALGGDRVARCLLWLSDNPALFVATTLVGNNVANYMTSFAIVLAAEIWFHSASAWLEVLLPIAISPVLFVYGELLPKSIYYHSANRSLRRGGWLFIAFTILLSPLAGFLWAVGRLLQRMGGQAPLRMQRTLARHELHQMMDEGHVAGVLRASQRQLAQNLIAEGTQPVRKHARALHRAAVISSTLGRPEALRAAQRANSPILLVHSVTDQKLVGYVRVIDLSLSPGPHLPALRPLLVVQETEPAVATLLQLRSSNHDVAGVANANGEIHALVFAAVLSTALLKR